MRRQVGPARHVVVAWIWLHMALVAAQKLGTRGNPDRDFYHDKLQTRNFFFRRKLPKTEHWYLLLNESDPTCENMRDEWF